MSTRAIRETAPFIGYALSRQPVHADAPSIPSHDDMEDDASLNERYDSRIMHHVVPATLELWRVELDAADERLSLVLGVELAEIRAHWLTSRTALIDPRPASLLKKTIPSAIPAAVGGYRRFSRRRHSCAEAAGNGNTYSKGLQTVSLATLQAYRDLASDLRGRLEGINEDEKEADYENKNMCMNDQESTSLESVSCGIEPIPIQKQTSKVDLDVLYGTPL